MRDHGDLLPETGAKRPFNAAIGGFAGGGCAGVAKLPDASSLLPKRAAKSWLCVQDTRTRCIGDALVTIAAVFVICNWGAIFAT